MNPWDLSASDLLIWGMVLHLIADWPLQNDWMANNKMKRRESYYRMTRGLAKTVWWHRHPAAYVHSGIHGVLLALVFGWVAAPLAFLHLLIDTRVPVVWWSNFIGQTQPKPPVWLTIREMEYKTSIRPDGAPLMDVGLEVRFWTDQVFHIACIALAAILVTL